MGQDLVADRSIGAGVAEIVIDPEVPAAARRELEQASLSALIGFSDPMPAREPPAGQDDEGAFRLARPIGVRVAVGGIVSVMATLLGVGLSTASPFSADLVYLAGVVILLCVAVGGLSAMDKDRRAAGLTRSNRLFQVRGAIPRRAAISVAASPALSSTPAIEEPTQE